MSYTSWIEAVKSVGLGKKHKPGDVWQTGTGWVGWRRGEDKAQYDLGDEDSAKAYVAGKDIEVDEPEAEPEKEKKPKTSGSGEQFWKHIETISDMDYETMRYAGTGSEWMDVGAWVYEHFNEIGGLSFLPYTDANYRQMPYEDCSEIEYKELLEKTPKKINWTKLSNYEKSDETKGSQELACTAGVCEVVDIVSGESPPELAHH